MLPLYIRSNAIFDSLGLQKGIGQLHSEIAVYYKKHNDTTRFFQALEIAELASARAGDEINLAIINERRATYFLQNAQFEKAKEQYLEVLRAREVLLDSIGMGYVLLFLSECALEQGDFAASIHYLDRSTEIRAALNDAQGLIINRVSKGEIALRNRQPEEAVRLFEKGLSQAQEIGFLDLEKYILEKLVEVNSVSGDFQKALQFERQKHHLQDSLFNIERSEKMTEMQAKYESDKKEQQLALRTAELKSTRFLSYGLGGAIVLLLFIGALLRNRLLLKQQKLMEEQKTKTKDAQLEVAIFSQEQERKRFARDLHDGFGQLISVLNLNLKSLEKMGSDREEIFKNSSLILDQMYKEIKGICFNLMPETLIKQGVVETFKELALRINQTGRVHVQIDAFGMEERLTDLQEISFYRIAQEWINNVLKYSDASKMVLSLTRDIDEVTLLIEDNGAGFDKDTLTSGVGNGWKNINARANLIKGELHLDTNIESKGNTLILNAPFVVVANQELAVSA